MKKKAIISILTVGIIGAAGWLYWYNIPVELDPIDQIEENNDNEVVTNDNQEEITDDQEETTDDVKKTSEDNINPSDIEQSETVDTVKPSQQVPSPEVNQQPAAMTPEELESKIITQYSSQFLDLKKKYEGKINNMIEGAKKEYNGLTEEEKKTAKYTMALKYLKKANALEDACDKEFITLLDKMKLELQENNLSTDAVKAAKKQYEDEKSARRKALLQKMMEKSS